MVLSMRIRRNIALTLVTAVGLTLVPAAAFGVNSEFALEVGQLDACSVGGDYGPDAGGWDGRNFTSRGTATGPEDLPVRPKSMRVGEPCLSDTGSYLYVPMLFSDVPVSMVDLDEDGDDDPLPPAMSVCSHVIPTFCAEVFDVIVVSPGSGPGFMICFTADGWFDAPASSYEDYDARIMAVFEGGVFELGTTVINPGAVAWQRACTDVGDSTHYQWLGSGSHELYGGFVGVIEQWRPPGGGEWQSGSLGDGVSGYYGGTQGADIHVVGNSYAPSGVPVVPASEVVCRSIYGDLGSRVTLPIEYWVSGFFGHLVPAVQEDDSVVWSGWGEYPIMAPLPADCTYLESISLTVCGPSGYGMDDWLCSILVWTADRALGKIPYTDDDPWVELCELTPLIPACIPILFPEPTDYTDFALVCADAPEPSWSDWGWLFAWVGHMAECLFVPQGGIDYRGHIQAQYDRIGISVMTESANQFAEALRLQGGQCGPIIDSNLPHLGQVTLNTCSWDVYSDVRNTLGAGIILLSIIWGLSVLIGMAESLFGRKGDFPLSKDDRQV